MAGYFEKSMSNNAVEAYNDGQMPKSKWAKQCIIERIEEEFPEKVEWCKKLTLAEMRMCFLRKSSWHHTSSYYNCTNFYEIDIVYLEKLTKETITDVISNRAKKVRRSSDAIIAEKKAKEREGYIRVYKKIAKECGQNELFINEKMVTNCSNEEIVAQATMLTNLKNDYNNHSSKYKTLRGYVNSVLKK